MRTLFGLLVTLVVATMALNLLTGCAARRAEARAKLPVAETVCLQIEGVKDPERGLVKRKAKAFLSEQGFRLVDVDCDVKLAYTALDQGQWEVMTTSPFSFRSRSSYRVEGLVSVSKRGGEPLFEDRPVNIRDYSSKADILEDLARTIVRYVTDNYRPAVMPRG